MKLSAEEQRLILGLARDPVFTGLLQRISTETRQLPRWKKGGDEAAKINAWVSSSGFVEGRDYVLKLLRYENE